MIFSSNIGIARFGITAMNFDFVAILVLILDSTIHVYRSYIIKYVFIYFWDGLLYLYRPILPNKLSLKKLIKPIQFIGDVEPKWI
jgi:hypothetical protein